MRITAAGSLPGNDFPGAVAAMAEACPDVLPWPELPDRGVTSGMIGRAVGLIDGLGFDLQPAGWRLTSGASADHRRARAQWRHDLDEVEELLQGFTATLKVGVAGPWTLAASVERPMGDRVLADHGARRELAQALAEGVAGLKHELSRRVPQAQILMQVDEPSLVAVASGTIPTASGFSKHRAVGRGDLAAALKPLAEDAWLHCCAPGTWLDEASVAGFAGVAIDTRLFHDVTGTESLIEWVHGGRLLAAGIVDTSASRVQSADQLVTEALRALRPLELDSEQWDSQVVLATGCGFANWPLEQVVPQLSVLSRAATLTAEALERLRP